MMSIPVVFIHKGDHFYLNYSLSQIKITNPNNPIYLITDSSVPKRFDFVNYININDHFKGAQEFAGIYKHMSTNGYVNELFCFQRWFVLKEFCEKYKLDKLLYLDSDVLLYCNVDETFSKYNDYDFTICKKIGPQSTYFPSREKLEKFCNFIPKLYCDTGYTGRFLQKHQHHLDNNLPGGVCDMTAFAEYQKEPGIKAADLNVIHSGEMFDDNINEAEGFSMKNGIKDLWLKDRFYYGTLIQNGQNIKFNILHFQGPAKRFIVDFYLGKDLKFIKLKLKLNNMLHDNGFLYKVARRLGYKFY